MGLSPSELINDMNNSYYSKLNRLLVDAEESEFEEVGFPSDQAYDFEIIGAVNSRKEVEKKKAEEKKKADFESISLQYSFFTFPYSL